MTQFGVAVSPTGRAVVFPLEGEFDIAAIEEFERAIEVSMDGSAVQLVVDLRRGALHGFVWPEGHPRRVRARRTLGGDPAYRARPQERDESLPSSGRPSPSRPERSRVAA